MIKISSPELTYNLGDKNTRFCRDQFLCGKPRYCSCARVEVWRLKIAQNIGFAVNAVKIVRIATFSVECDEKNHH